MQAVSAPRSPTCFHGVVLSLQARAHPRVWTQKSHGAGLMPSEIDPAYVDVAIKRGGSALPAHCLSMVPAANPLQRSRGSAVPIRCRGVYSSFRRHAVRGRRGSPLPHAPRQPPRSARSCRRPSAAPTRRRHARRGRRVEERSLRGRLSATVATGSPDQDRARSASQCSLCCGLLVVSLMLICVIVICDIFTKASDAPNRFPA
jgi:hypothetical protein